MKKLFSAMLAATMVAGASITAFAYKESKAEWTTNYFDDNDYAVIGAYDDEGNKLEGEKAKLDSGDKIYYPILISGDEIDKDVLTDNNRGEEMFFADKASEIKDLKASVKDEIGGKYIDSASIVKKDIKIDKEGIGITKGIKQSFKVDMSKVTAVDIKDNDTVTLDLGAAGIITTDKLGATTKVEDVITELETAAEKKGYDVTVSKKEMTFTAKAAADNKTLDKTPALTVENAGKTTGTKQSFKVDMSKVTAVDIKDDDTVTLDLGAAGTITTDKLSATTKVADVITALKTAAGNKGYDVTVLGTEMTFTAKKAEDNKTLDTTPEIKVSGAGTVTGSATAKAEKDGVAPTGAPTGTITGKATASVIKDGKAPTGNEGNAVKKVYCVEVKMADYFKNEETEVEFNIKLKNKGKTEYDTDDDNKLFNGTFDLGKDAEKLEHKKSVNGVECKKFKNGDLEIKIGKDSKSVELEEAIASNGKVEDIDNIYIENDDTIDNAFTFDVKASGQDDLYLELNQDAVKDLAVSNQKADLVFFNFPGEPEFDFSGTATFAVEDEDEDNYFYEIVDGELVETKAKYDEDDGVFKLRTNKLTSYVISDKELDTATDKDEDISDKEDKDHETVGGDSTTDSSSTSGDKANANTGAADLIGVASALAVVSVATAGVVALKK